MINNYQLTMSENIVVKLNEFIGRHLLKFLDGVNAANFIEPVDCNEQFGPTTETSDHSFIQSISRFFDCQRILLPHALFQDFMGENEIDEDQLIVVSTRYSSVIQPSECLYIHPCFSLECFSKVM